MIWKGLAFRESGGRPPSLPRGNKVDLIRLKGPKDPDSEICRLGRGPAPASVGYFLRGRLLKYSIAPTTHRNLPA